MGERLCIYAFTSALTLGEFHLWSFPNSIFKCSSWPLDSVGLVRAQGTSLELGRFKTKHSPPTDWEGGRRHYLLFPGCDQIPNRNRRKRDIVLHGFGEILVHHDGKVIEAEPYGRLFYTGSQFNLQKYKSSTFYQPGSTALKTLPWAEGPVFKNWSLMRTFQNQMLTTAFRVEKRPTGWCMGALWS